MSFKNRKPSKCIVRYRMEGCSPCMDSQKAWNDAKRRINRHYIRDPNVKILEVESAKLNEFNQQFNLLNKHGLPFTPEGFPTHMFFINGREVPTELHDRTAKSFVKSIVEQFQLLKKPKSTRKRKKKGGGKTRRRF